MRPELEKKVQSAIHLIQAASEMAKKVDQPLEVAFSGGKDSAVILELTKMANVPYRAIYKNTTIDPPGTIKYCKDNGVEIINPKMNFLDLIKYGGFPNRFMRNSYITRTDLLSLWDFLTINIETNTPKQLTIFDYD